MDVGEDAVRGRIFGQNEEACGKHKTGYEAGAICLFCSYTVT